VLVTGKIPWNPKRLHMLYLVDNDPVVPYRYPDSVRYFLLCTSECTERTVLTSYTVCMLLVLSCLVSNCC